jgi:hypothetical protein
MPPLFVLRANVGRLDELRYVVGRHAEEVHQRNNAE